MTYLNTKLIVYDIEVFPNCFLLTALDTSTDKLYTFEISGHKNDWEVLSEFMLQDAYFVGYNNLEYDDVIVNAILRTTNPHPGEIYEWSTALIDQTYNPKHFRRFKSIDLMKLIYPNKLQQSLKWTQIVTHYENVQEFSIGFNTNLTRYEIDLAIEYNINDVLSTENLLKLNATKLASRESSELRYGIHCASMDDVTFGEALFNFLYKANGGIIPSVRNNKDWNVVVFIKDLLLYDYEFYTPTIKEWFKQFIEQPCNLENPTIEEHLIINGCKITISSGGIHSVNKPKFYESTNGVKLIDYDAGSLYPSMLVLHKLFPEVVKDKFSVVYDNIRLERLQAKRDGNVDVANDLKLSLNGISGKLGQPTSWMYDPECVIRLRLNCQLLLLLLIDRLADRNIVTFMANTDGITLMCKEDQIEVMENIVSDFEKFSGLLEVQSSMERVDYNWMAVESVSSYVAKTVSGKIKAKGRFIPNLSFDKSLRPKAVSKAVIAYFDKGILPKDYINSDEVVPTDFLIGHRINKKYTLLWGGRKTQRLTRYYVSKRGLYLDAIDADMKMKRLNVKPVWICNKLDGLDVSNIDKEYYINEAMHQINNIHPFFKQLTIF